MKFLVLIPLLCVVVSGAERVAKDVGSKQRSADLTLPGIGEVDVKDLTKLFSLPNISIPTLAPLFPEGAPCVSTLSARVGTCKKREECQASHGLPDGSCALSLGVCCTKPFTCGSLIMGNVSLISNPGYPAPSQASDACQFTITKMPTASQIRLDFEDFEIGGVDEEGKCSQDVFEVEGANPGFKIPKLCGMNRGQHLYIPVDKTGLLSQVKLRFVFSGTPADRLYKIRVTQLGLDHPVLAPAGCLQYFTGRNGEVSSFNFEHNKRVGIKTIKGLNYGVCFRKENGFCSLKVEPVFTRSRRSIPYRFPIQPNQYQPQRFVPFPPARMTYGPPAPKPFYGVKHDNFYPSKTEIVKETKIEAKVELVKDLIAEKMKLIEQVLSGLNLPGLQVPSVTAIIEAELRKLIPVKEAVEKVIEAKLEKPQYNNNKYLPSKPDILETKIDLVKDLIGEKTQLIGDKLKPLAPKVNYNHNNYYSKPEIVKEAKLEVVKDLIEDKLKPQVPKYNYHHNNYFPSKPDILETKIDLVKDLIGEKTKLIGDKLRPQYPKVNYNQNNYHPSKPDILETKIEITKDLIEEKTKLIEELLSGRKQKEIFPGLAIPVLPTLPALPALPVLPSLPTVQTITDEAIKKLLPGGDLVEKAISTAIVAPDFVDNGSVCNDRDSIGIPPHAVLCEENAQPTVISTTPFAVFVDTRGSISSRGFHFVYTQQICQ